MTQEELNLKLLSAVKEGNLEKVKEALEQGADINSDKTGSALYWAIHNGRSEMALYLIEKGADVNKGFSDRESCIEVAAKKGDINLVEKLLEKGADINGNVGKFSPLYYAVIYGYYNIVSFLIENGADINKECGCKEYPINIAVKSGFIDRVKILIENGADISKADINGKAAIHYATLNAIDGSTDVLHFLIEKGADVNAQTERGNTLLAIAAEKGNIYIASFLIAKGANIHTTNRGGESPIETAIKNGNTDFVSFLIAKGANIHTTNKLGNSPLVYAIRKGDQLTSIVLNVKESEIKQLRDNSGLSLRDLYSQSILYKNGNNEVCIEAKILYSYVKMNKIFLNYADYIATENFESELFSDLLECKNLIKDLKQKSALSDKFEELYKSIYSSDESESPVPTLAFITAAKIIQNLDSYKDSLDRLPILSKGCIEEILKATYVRYDIFQKAASIIGVTLEPEVLIGEAADPVSEMEA